MLRLHISIPVLTIFCLTTSADYWIDRHHFIKNERAQAVGADIVLNAKEALVNAILMRLKEKEYNDGFADPQDFLPSVHFFHGARRIAKSPVYKFLKKVPKGASLHSHDTALVSENYIYNLTYSENLYGCVVDGRLKLHFFEKPNNTVCQWELMTDLRAGNASFDAFVRSELSIIVKDPAATYPNINVIWKRFLQTFDTVTSMLCYKPVFEQYFYKALEELYEDNIRYIEFRGTLPTVYDLDGTEYGPDEVVGLYVKTLERFKKDYPDFFGARFIYAPSRGADNSTFDEYITILSKLLKLYPNFIAGFDLVGEEDRGRPLIDFVPKLLELSPNVKFFFHAGETDWNGVSTDYNLVDAVLLNATRIGHGFAVVKHPKVLEEVKKRQIAIEINPISNQVLKLVDDLRNHPGNYLIAKGFPVVICNDDPSFWGGKALTYDWYMTFMGLSSREDDLRLLKQLAINSIKFSVMEHKEKTEAFERWELEWDIFIDKILEENNVQTYFDYVVKNVR